MLLNFARLLVDWSRPCVDAELGGESFQESDRFEEDVWDARA